MVQAKEHTVASMTFRSALVAAALAVSSTVFAQPTGADGSLMQAAQLVAQVTVPQTGGEPIAALKQDFTDFATAYLATADSPAAAVTPGAVGTSGRADTRADWRTKYQRVEADLAALLGPVGNRASFTAAAQLDPDTRSRLESVRTRLQIFYAATLGQPDGNPVAHTGTPATRPTETTGTAQAPVAPTAQAPQTVRSESPTSTATPPAPTGGTNPLVDTAFGSAIAMLDRMQRILDEATKDPGKVSLDRPSVDEMRAEIAQIRTLLQSRSR